jgi:hypothetical protein
MGATHIRCTIDFKQNIILPILSRTSFYQPKLVRISNGVNQGKHSNVQGKYWYTLFWLSGFRVEVRNLESLIRLYSVC